MMKNSEVKTAVSAPNCRRHSVLHDFQTLSARANCSRPMSSNHAIYSVENDWRPKSRFWTHELLLLVLLVSVKNKRLQYIFPYLVSSTPSPRASVDYDDPSSEDMTMAFASDGSCLGICSNLKRIRFFEKWQQIWDTGHQFRFRGRQTVSFVVQTYHYRLHVEVGYKNLFCHFH